MKLKSIGYSLTTTIILSGCISPYQTNFDCPVAQGVPCTSMSKINHMIDKGLLGKPESEEECTCKNSRKEDIKHETSLFITYFGPEAQEEVNHNLFTEKAVVEPSTEDISALDPLELSNIEDDYSITDEVQNPAEFLPSESPSIEEASKEPSEVPPIEIKSAPEAESETIPDFNPEISLKDNLEDGLEEAKNVR